MIGNCSLILNKKVDLEIKKIQKNLFLAFFFLNFYLKKINEENGKVC